MNEPKGLLAGYSKVDITAPLGTHMPGYFEPRYAEAVLDPNLVTTLAVRDGDQAAIVFAADTIGIGQEQSDAIRQFVADTCGLERRQVFLSSSHTHYGPEISNEQFAGDPIYQARLPQLFAQAAMLALNDLAPARIETARGKVRDVGYIRRFRMKDGAVVTNPGIRNPKIDRAVGEADEDLQVVRLLRDGAPEIILVNFQVHADVVAEHKFSADYVGFVRQTLEDALGGSVRCIYINGAAGDVNHINVQAPEGRMIGGYAFARHMGRAIAGSVLQVLDFSVTAASSGVDAVEQFLEVRHNKADPSELPAARGIVERHAQGCDHVSATESGMSLTTIVAEAQRKLSLADAPDTRLISICAVRFGDVCLTGIPGEPFTAIGRQIKDGSPFGIQLVSGLANGCEGYYPTRNAYDEGGYEARSATFVAGTAERIGEACLAAVRELADRRQAPNG